MKKTCIECYWAGDESEVLKAQNPFNGEEMDGCPKCREANTMVGACDEPGCAEISTCGFPTQDGYRRTCGKHYREAPL